MKTKNVPSYQTGLEELVTNLSAALPESALATFNRDATQLGENHLRPLRLNAGDKAPRFSLPDATGQPVHLTELLREGSVVLTFYRGAWCPYCNLQLSQYQQILPEIRELGATLVAISPQTPDASLSLQEKSELTFHVLSDAGNLVARQYTTVFRNAHEPLAAMKSLDIDFGSYYGDDSAELPVPAVFIVDRNGIITFARSTGGDYRNRVEPAEILEALEANRN